MLQSVIQQGDDKRFLSTEHLGTEAIAAFVDGELSVVAERRAQAHLLSLIHISEPTRRLMASRLPSSA